MSWIATIDYDNADAQLKKTYDQIKGPDGTIDNVVKIHSLRPHTMSGHISLYRSVLHHSGNTLPRWYLEALGVYTSALNKCVYCVTHHFEGMKKLLQDDVRATTIMNCIQRDDISKAFEGKNLEGFHYAKKLTLTHTAIVQNDIMKLKDAGFTDGEILEINQVVSYFNYVNRTVLGLGVDLKGDVLGTSPDQNTLHNPEL